ncbi:MAG: hypothetical protein R2797_12795 [Gelidibacter sp.]
MKKIITLCFFAFAFIVGTQTVAAQSMTDINAVAAHKTQELKKAIKFNNATENSVFKAYQAYEKKIYSMNDLIARGKTISDEDRAKIENMLTDKFKSIFTEEQFNQYLKFAETQK